MDLVHFENSAARVWRQLPLEDRLEASEAFWAEPPNEALGGALVAIVRARHIRPQAARALTDVAKKEALATILDPGEPVAASLLVALHLRKRRDLLVAFLDAVQISHENGLIQETEPSEPASIERVRAGIAALKAFPAHKAGVYLNVLWLQDPEKWSMLPGLAETL
jgi:hypothetical protein